MKFILMVAVVLVSGCATTFIGEARVANGAAGCQVKCSAQGMELAGMIVMGEDYTDGCICNVKGKAGSAAIQGAPSASAAVAGVTLQAQRAAAQRARAQTPQAH